MTVRELLARTSSRELTEWAAYERISGPLGYARADLQAAIVASTVASVHSGKGARRPMPKDFIPVWDKRPASAEELFAKVQQANAMFGGTTQNPS
jgi:hypothetical protein